MPTPFLSSEEYDERAHQLYNEGQYDEALDVLREGLGLYPNSVELHIGVGYAHHAREEYAWARRSFEEALVLDPDHEDALAGLGETLLKFGQQEPALRSFRHTLELGYQDDVELMLQIGRALFREGLIDESKQFFEIAAQQTPDAAEAVSCIGYAEHRLGNDESAISTLRRALQMDPDHTEARIYLGNIFYDRGDYEAALYHLDRSTPEDHWDELGIWRLIELKKMIYRLRDNDPELRPWEDRLRDLSGELDDIDEMLAEIEAKAMDAARLVLAHFDTPRSAEDLAADIIDLWTGAQGALQALVGNTSLTGQQLIRAARQAELITLEQAHASLEFLAARDRANRTSYKPTQADGDAAVEGFKALEAALTGAPRAATHRPTPTSPLQAAYPPRRPRPAPPPPPPAQPASPIAPPSAGGGYRQPPAYAGRKMAGPPTIELPGAFMSEGGGGGKTPPGPGGVGRGQVEHALAAAERRRWPSLSTPVWIAIGAVIVLIVGGFLLFGRGPSGGESVTTGIDAMKNGQLERARGEFAKAVKSDPNAATPHVFLARLSRDQGDLATARAELDTALRLEPRNANALREMGLVLFASRQYDLARRFFIRPVQANPQDRAAQGYLGCAMIRLNRVPEGTNFINKAGNGAWTACLAPATTTTPPPL